MDLTGSIAGKVAARAIVSVQGGETLIPMLAVENESGGHVLHRLIQEPPEESIRRGQELFDTNGNEAQRAAFVHDARLNTDEGGDALVLQATAYRDSAAVVHVVIPYRNAKSPGGFQVFAPLVTAPDHVSDDALSDWMSAFWSGVRLDEEAASLCGAPSASPTYARVATPRWRLKDPARGSLSDGERTLLAAPALVFSIVTSAGGDSADEAAIASFSDLLSEASEGADRAIAMLATASIEMLPVTLRELDQGPDPLQRLREAADALATLSPEVARRFRDWLLFLGETVARSKRRAFMRGKVGADQQRALDLLAEALTPPGAISSVFSESEAESLRLVPIIVFGVVASADADITPAEIEAFGTILRSRPTTKSELFDAALTEAAAVAGDRISAVLDGRIDVNAELRKVRELVDARLSEGEALEFKRALIAFGFSIARASRAGDDVPFEEAEVLAKLAGMFGVQLV